MACTPPKRKASTIDRSPSRPMKACRLFLDPVETIALSVPKFLKGPVSLFTTHEVVQPEDEPEVVQPEDEPEVVQPEDEPEVVEMPHVVDSEEANTLPDAPEPQTTPYTQCFLSLKRLSEVPSDLMGGDMVRLFWKTAFHIFAVGVDRLSLPKLASLKKNIEALPVDVLEEVFELLKWMGEEEVDLVEIPHEYVLLLKIAVASQHRNNAVKARFLRKLRVAFFSCPS